MDGEEVKYFQNKNLSDIVTPVNIGKFEEMLKEANYDENKINFLIDGFTNGFDSGYEGPEQVQISAPNLKFTVGNRTILWNKVMKEVEVKRYAGPFETIPFEFFIQSPIGLVPKDGDKTRLIFHLSYPRDDSYSSVNINTPKELKTVHYKDFDQAVQLCVRLLKNKDLEHTVIFFGKSDLTSAFRQLPLKRKCWNFLVMKAKDPVTGKFFFFVDKCLPFGAGISCAIFQAVSDALAHLVRYHTGQENVNYLDDFLFLELLKTLCNLQLDVFLSICNTIKLPVALEKTVWAVDCIAFLGLLLDGRRHRIAIPCEKIDRAVSLIKPMVKKKKTTLREMQQLCGFLNFLTKCIIPGRVFLRRLYPVGSHLKFSHYHLNINQEVRLDLEMWQNFLEAPEALYHDFFEFDNDVVFSPIDFYTDASRNKDLGAGGYFGRRWFVIQWEEKFIKKMDPSINYLELYALTVGVLLWCNELVNRKCTIFCDNQSVIYMVNKGTSKCKNCLVLLRIITLHCLSKNVKLRVRYVPSGDNTYADLLSRMRYDKFRAIARKNNRIFNGSPDNIPDCLWPMDKIWLK